MELEPEIAEVGQRDWHELYGHLRSRHISHVRGAVKHTTRYKRIATLLHILIPSVSLALTILVGSEFKYQHVVTAWTAIALTVLTGTNYTLEPGLRYRAYAETCIQLHDWMYAMESEVEKLAEHGSTEKLLDYLVKMNIDFSVIGRNMVELPVPRVRVG